ncbi:MAG: response regulator transcription factor [Coriobacteriales bacterium]|nr:response regulator transcription factor [Coriobacteriales bacterium]
MRIVLIDEHEFVRIGLKTVLQHESDIEVVADCESLEVLRTMMIGVARPDMLLIDIPDDSSSARRCEALDALEVLHQQTPQVKVVLLSTTFDLDCLLHTLSGNSAGYLLKNASPEELLAAVRAVAFGGVYIHSKLIASFPKQLLHSCGSAARAAAAAPPLSDREQGVLTLLVHGHTNREVSERLYLSPKTVESYRARLYTKLGAKSRADLVAFATQSGLVTL